MTGKDKHSRAADTENAETVRGTRSTARLSVWIAVAIVAVSLIGYLTSRSSFTEKDVAAGMAAFSKDIAGYFETGGYEGEFGYTSLALKGSVFSRKALLQDPVFLLRRTDNGEEVRVSTPSAILDPSDATLADFDLIAEEPLIVGKGEKEYRIIPQLPARISVKRRKNEEEKKIEYTLRYPEDANYIVQVGAAGERPAGDASYQLHLGAGSALKGVLDLAEKSYYEEATFNASSVEFARSILKADAVRTVYESAVSESSSLRHYTVESSGVSAAGAYEALGTLSVGFEVETEQPLASPVRDHMLEITRLTVKGEDFSVTGEGKLEIKESDLLPYGTLDTEITAVDALLARLAKAAVIPEVSVPVVKSALEKAATESEDTDTLALHLERMPGGAFMVGNSTFEELTLSVFQDFMKGGAAPVVPAPAAPAAEAPTEEAVPPASAPAAAE